MDANNEDNKCYVCYYLIKGDKYMYKGKKILSIIPARGGSKGIKKKNIIELNGKPLISYTIESSLLSSYIDRTIVSTDSIEIANVSLECGASVPFMRPSELATDEAKTIDVVLHTIETLKSKGEEYDIMVLLQPTQPLRTWIDIDKSIELFFKKNLKGLVSVSIVDDHPILMRTIGDNGELCSLLGENSTCRRQDMKLYYKVNGCIYINSINEIKKDTSFNDNSVGFVMEQSHSVDIDELKDLAVAEYFLNQRE